MSTYSTSSCIFKLNSGTSTSHAQSLSADVMTHVQTLSDYIERTSKHDRINDCELIKLKSENSSLTILVTELTNQNRTAAKNLEDVQLKLDISLANAIVWRDKSQAWENKYEELEQKTERERVEWKHEKEILQAEHDKKVTEWEELRTSKQQEYNDVHAGLMELTAEKIAFDMETKQRAVLDEPARLKQEDTKRRYEQELREQSATFSNERESWQKEKDQLKSKTMKYKNMCREMQVELERLQEQEEKQQPSKKKSTNTKEKKSSSKAVKSMTKRTHEPQTPEINSESEDEFDFSRVVNTSLDTSSRARTSQIGHRHSDEDDKKKKPGFSLQNKRQRF